jgi:Ca-activated chloride channel family protein
LLAALRGIRPNPNGNTGLYNTLLAAYRAVQEGWDPVRGNSVVVITDGRNDDPQGLTLDQLIAQLKQVAIPDRPIQVIVIGIGTEVSGPELGRITSTTGGAVFIAPDPSTIGEIFQRALAFDPGN